MLCYYIHTVGTYAMLLHTYSRYVCYAFTYIYSRYVCYAFTYIYSRYICYAFTYTYSRYVCYACTYIYSRYVCHAFTYIYSRYICCAFTYSSLSTYALTCIPNALIRISYFQLIYQEVMFPLLCYDDEDDQLWREDPQEYIRMKYGMYVRTSVCTCVHVCMCACVCGSVYVCVELGTNAGRGVWLFVLTIAPFFHQMSLKT